jgi:GxxExxY protein
LTYRFDLRAYDKIIIEARAVRQVADEHRAQVFNYVRAAGLRLGLLVNFSSYPKVEYERIVV